MDFASKSFPVEYSLVVLCASCWQDFVCTIFSAHLSVGTGLLLFAKIFAKAEVFVAPCVSWASWSWELQELWNVKSAIGTAFM